jgi:nucleoside-diphosphate-sugar epimerase
MDVVPQLICFLGAGGKGGPSRTYAIDRDAAKHYIKAAVETPTVTKFLMVSYIGSRKNRAPWWTDEEWKSAQQVNKEILPDYHKAKVEADEFLAALAKKRSERDPQFQAIDLRPGNLTDDPAKGKVSMGKTASRGKVSREDVALAAIALLKKNDISRWVDLLEGDVDIDVAVDNVIKNKVDCIAGEDLDRIYSLVD